MLLAVVIVVLALVAIFGWYEVNARPLGGPGKRVVVEVSSGESTGAVAATLQKRGVIGSSLAFQLSLVIHGKPTIQTGGYVFHQNQPFSTVRTILAGGPNIYVLGVLPGYTIAEVANQLGALPGNLSQGFVAASKSGAVTSPFEPSGTNNLEGLLGTGNFQILPGETDQQLLSQMVSRFNQQAAAAGLNAASAAKLGMTPYQLVTVASIVQKEGYYDKNMPNVARVIYNRVAAGMALAMTSTVLYSLGQDGGTVTSADRKLDTPYNTYLNTGLTPTPICLSSPAALAAAASPPAGPWLYFVVVQKDGTEAFATTYQQQLANEQLAKTRGVG